jgi:hypothetical protein
MLLCTLDNAAFYLKLLWPTLLLYAQAHFLDPLEQERARPVAHSLAQIAVFFTTPRVVLHVRM